jgi:hypothetical protein
MYPWGRLNSIRAYDDRAEIGVGRKRHAAPELRDLRVDELDPSSARDRDPVVTVDDEVPAVDLVHDDRREVALGEGLLDVSPALLDLRALRQEVAIEVVDPADGADYVGDADRPNADVGLLERAQPPRDLVQRQEGARALSPRDLGQAAVGLAASRLSEGRPRVGTLLAHGSTSITLNGTTLITRVSLM